MKAGSEKPPIFITHGLCGTGQFFELAERIRTKHPVYGIQGKGIDDLEEPFDRVEDMAKFYLEALEELYPQGPYILIGYSFGGLVALEMAQHLLETGKNVALLVLLDASPLYGVAPASAPTCATTKKSSQSHATITAAGRIVIFFPRARTAIAHLRSSRREPEFPRDDGLAGRRDSFAPGEAEGLLGVRLLSAKVLPRQDKLRDYSNEVFLPRQSGRSLGRSCSRA